MNNEFDKPKNTDFDTLKKVDYKSFDVTKFDDIRYIPGINEIAVKDRKPSKAGLVLVIIMYCLAFAVLLFGVSRNLSIEREHKACTEIVTGVCTKEYEGTMYITHRGPSRNDEIEYQDFIYEYTYQGDTYTVSARMRTENNEPKVVGQSYSFRINPRYPEKTYIPEAIEPDSSGRVFTFMGVFMLVAITVTVLGHLLKQYVGY